MLPYVIVVLVLLVLATFFVATFLRSRRKGSILVTNIAENGEAQR